MFFSSVIKYPNEEDGKDDTYFSNLQNAKDDWFVIEYVGDKYKFCENNFYNRVK